MVGDTQQAVGVSMFGAGLLLGAIGLLNLLQNPLAIRLLSPLPLALLLVATVVNVIVSAEATYLRAFKREPFLVISVLNALLIGCWTCSVGRTYGALGMMVGYMLINGAVGLGLGTWIFLHCRRTWSEDSINVGRTPIASTQANTHVSHRSTDIVTSPTS